jgi:trigger factor
MPEVELGPYKGLSVEERDCKIAEEDIKGEIEALRERNAAVSKKEDDGRVEKGDLVKFKIKRIDNVDTDGVDKVDFRDYSIIVGKSKEDHTIDKDILGMKAGEEKEVKVKYPKDYSVKDLAGQTVKYLVRIEEISSMDLPALDDDFAKDLGEHATLEDLKKGIRSNMEEFVRSKVRGEAKNRLLKQVVEGSKFDIPESMVIREMDSVFRRVQERTGYHAQDINQFTSTLGLDPEDFSRQIKEEAAANIKSTLALSEIAKKEELKVPEERYREILSGIAKKNNKSVEDLEKLIGDSGSRESIESELILEAAIDFVYSNATVKKTKPVSLDKFIKGD